MNLTPEGFRAMIFYDFRCHLNQQESYNRIILDFHDAAPSFATVYNWVNEFKRGRNNLTDDLREGCSSIATIEDNISAVRFMIKTDKTVTYPQIRTSLSIAHTARRRINFLRALGREILDHPPYSPTLETCDFYLVSKIKGENKKCKRESKELKIKTDLVSENGNGIKIKIETGAGRKSSHGEDNNPSTELAGTSIQRSFKRSAFCQTLSKAFAMCKFTFKGIAHAARVTWGLSSEIMRAIYIAVIEPMLLYAACAWAQAVGRLDVRKMLKANQRNLAIKACRAYRTISLIYALILSRLLPVDIRAWLYEVKRGKELGDISADWELEKPVRFCESPLPGTAPDIHFESVKSLDSETIDRLAIGGPHIFTDGSRIKGKVVAALIEWRDGVDTGHSAFRLETFYTRRSVRLFWVRAHAGTVGNERADELVRNAAIKKKAKADYDRFLLIYANGQKGD
ncbi:hypothetical protein EVAR_96222_1 [Eumeta japonica]|uniref:Uncharacterized protein n=1 Tax=Eumeta variegata TaxID=151549 RepID=A0A4C1WJK3_EUMVA|nr:hypothetical protein EVAR_96222_1 [Eumeta japonica]